LTKGAVEISMIKGLVGCSWMKPYLPDLIARSQEGDDNLMRLLNIPSMRKVLKETIPI